MHHTNQQGDIGVAKVIADLLANGERLLQPIDSTCPYDLAIDKGGKLTRVQVKYRTVNNGVLQVQLRRASVCYGKPKYRRNEEVDLIAIYSPTTDACYYIPVEELDGKGAISLRVEPAKNGQRSGIKLADDYRGVAQ